VKRYWTGITLALGPAILITTVVWEIARMVPDYAFVISPWAIEGHETAHGWVFLTLGVSLLVASMLVLWEASTSGFWRLVTLAFFVVAGTAIAIVFAQASTTVTMGPVLGMALALSLSLIVLRFAGSSLVKAVPFLGRGWVKGVLLFVVWGIFYLILAATVVDEELTVSTGIGVFVGLLLFAVYASAAEPRGLAGNRMLIYTSMVAGLVVVLSAGAIRSSLTRIQFETSGFAAEYGETQVSLGWFIAVFAILVLFSGAVGLWAKRQDLLVAMVRARRQREAAEKSAAEIKAAEEAYLAETAAGGSSVQA